MMNLKESRSRMPTPHTGEFGGIELPASKH